MIFVHLFIVMKFPYQKSSRTIMDLTNLWNGKLLRISTNKKYADIMIPIYSFKKIFGENPRVKKYVTPANTERYISEIEVKKILTK